jgi:phosphoserine phosphatase
MSTGVAILDMDGTLLSKRSIDVFCAELGFTERLAQVDRLSSHLPAYKISEIIASFFKGIPRRRLEGLFDSIPLNEGADDFVSFLKSKGFFVAVATDSYDFLAERLTREIDADAAYGNIVEVRGDFLTGNLLTDRRCLKVEGCREYSTCKLWFMRKLNNRLGGLTLAVGDGDSDLCAIGGADMGVAYRPKTNSIAVVADFVASDYSHIESWLEEEITTRPTRGSSRS